MFLKRCLLFVLVSFIWLNEASLAIEVAGRVRSRSTKVKMSWIPISEKLLHSCVNLTVVSLFPYLKTKQNHFYRNTGHCLCKVIHVVIILLHNWMFNKFFLCTRVLSKVHWSCNSSKCTPCWTRVFLNLSMATSRWSHP